MSISTPYGLQDLKNVLLVLNITKNLLSVGKLIDNLFCVTIFSSNGFVIRDEKTWKTLPYGHGKGGLCMLEEACALFSTNESFREDLAPTIRKLYTKIISYLKQNSIC